MAQRYSETELRQKMDRLQADVAKKVITKADMAAEVNAYRKQLALQDKADALELKNRLQRARLESKELKRLGQLSRQGVPVMSKVSSAPAPKVPAYSPTVCMLLL